MLLPLRSRIDLELRMGVYTPEQKNGPSLNWQKNIVLMVNNNKSLVRKLSIK